MTSARRPAFNTVDDLIADVRQLRQGYVRHGNWTLAQICWHLGFPLRRALHPPEPADLAPTPEQLKMKAALVDRILKGEPPAPEFREAPASMQPAADLTDAEIDGYLELLAKLKAYPHPKVYTVFFGPLRIDEFRGLTLGHAAHHLSYLVPTDSKQ